MKSKGIRMTTLLQKIFSVKNSNDKSHKIWTIIGIKINLKKRVPINVPLKKLRMVEIEIFSYCNRKCWFCPNSFIDRHSQNNIMPEELYINVLKDLASIDYAGIISYSRYNEPLSNRDIFIERVKQARKILPNAKLHTNTNGDFITRELLDEIYDAGLRSLNIQCYLREDEIFDTNNIKARIQKMSEKLNLKYTQIKSTPDYYGVAFDYKDMSLSMYARNFKITGNNRGGSLKTISKITRKSPCYIPFTDIYIDYNGSVMPCCNLRSDLASHKNFIMGNVSSESIIRIFNNNKYKNLRKKLNKNKIEIYPCNECNFAQEYKY